MKENEEKKNYEMSFLVVNKGDESVIDSTVIRHGAEIKNRGLVVELKLSYPIKKHRIAHFGFLQFDSFPEEIEKIAHDLKLNPAVLRTLVITPPIMKNEGRRARRGEEKKVEQEAAKAPPFSAAPRGVLTNKDLEEKLEEILK